MIFLSITRAVIRPGNLRNHDQVNNDLRTFTGPFLRYMDIFIEVSLQHGGKGTTGLPHMGVLAAQSCPTLCDPMDCSPPGSSVHGISQTRILEWSAISFFRGAAQTMDQAHVSCLAGRFFTVWSTREAQGKGRVISNKIKYSVMINTSSLILFVNN